MKKDMLSKTLVLGVILLFIGISFQPAYAVESKLSADSTENDEDCNCKEIDRLDLIRANLLLNKLEILTNILLFRYGHLPEIEESFQELLDIIKSYRQVNHQIICKLLENIVPRLESIYLKLENIQSKLLAKHPFIGGFLSTFIEIVQGLTYEYHQLLCVIGYHLCNWPWPLW